MKKLRVFPLLFAIVRFNISFVTGEDDVWEIEEITFSRFDIDHPKSELPYRGDSDAYLLQESILPIIIQIYTHAHNKNKILSYFSLISENCANTKEKDAVQLMCQGIVNTILGEDPKISDISLSDIQTALEQEKERISGKISPIDIDKHYPWVSYPYMTVRARYAIGDYLLGVVDAYPIDSLLPSSNFDGLVILKAGDSHRQGFSQILDPSNPSQGERSFYPRYLTLKNGALYLSVFSKKAEEENKDNFLVYEFVLREDGKREKSKCGKATEVEVKSLYGSYDKEMTTSDLPLSSCNDDMQVIAILK